MARTPELPERIGFLGVGTIGSAIVRGLASHDSLRPKPKLILSPRNRVQSKRLAAEFPGLVHVAASNQDVIDQVECVFLTFLPKHAEEVLKGSIFRKGQQIISLLAMIKLARIKELVSPAIDFAIVTVLPAVASRQAAALGVPYHACAHAIFSQLGSYTAVKTEAQFAQLSSITSFMGDCYKRQLTMQEWLVRQGIAAEQAAKWVHAVFSTWLAGSANPGPETYDHCLSEQTVGGLNERVWKEQEEDGIYKAITYSLDSVLHRKLTGEIDPTLAPALQRARL